MGVHKAVCYSDTPNLYTPVAPFVYFGKPVFYRSDAETVTGTKLVVDRRGRRGAQPGTPAHE